MTSDAIDASPNGFAEGFTVKLTLQTQNLKNLIRHNENSAFGSALYLATWIIMASAMLIESDAYRYASIFLVITALTTRSELVSKVSHDWLARLCYAWSAYVLLRFFYGIIFWGEKGTSEWLYAFPAFFPVIGVMLYVQRRYIYGAATAFIVFSLLALVATVDYSIFDSGSRAAPLFHHNPIHAGVGCGMIFICSVFWLLYSAEAEKLHGVWKWPMVAVGAMTASLSLLGALGAQSKGVWLALAATTSFAFILCGFYFRGRLRMAFIGALAGTSTAISALVYPYVQHVAGTTSSALAALIENAISTGSLTEAIRISINAPSTPNSLAERLQLLFNAIELIGQSPWIGWGNLWLEKWRETTYSHVPYTIIHNGYLEILVRHGIIGIAFVLSFATISALAILKALRRERIFLSTAFFLYTISFYFFSTIATNSNNRLAIGESFFILVGASVFALSLLNQPATNGRE